MKLKKMLALALALFLLMIALAGCNKEEPSPGQPKPPAGAAPAEATPEPEPARFVPGTYTAVCKGFYGDFDVKVAVSESDITDISYGEYKETEALGGKAIRMLADEIKAKQNAGVDVVTGATITSAVFRAAVQDCLKQAGAPESVLQPLPPPNKEQKAVTTDVLVIGAGAAGFAAAIEAAGAGADVIMIEKQDITGGSTVTSAGIVYAAKDEKDIDDMVAYYMERANGNASEEKLRFFAEHSSDTITFLEGLGIKWLMTVPAGTSPVERARFSQMPDGSGMNGAALINPLEEKARALGVEILTGVTATSLIPSDSGVGGAKASSEAMDYTFGAKAVVLATGGFDASPEMIAEHSPIATGDFPLSSKGNVGDGIRMGMEMGAATEFKGGVIGFAIVDASLPESGFNAIAMYPICYVKSNGTYVGNLVDYPITYSKIKGTQSEFFYGLYDGLGGEQAMRAVEKGFGFKGETMEELAAAAGMDSERLIDAMRLSKEFKEGPYYAVVVKPSTIGSMGGLVTDVNAQVVKESGEVIPGLYAAGEVANGAFYYQEYPASGSSISLALTYGRVAGQFAATK